MKEITGRALLPIALGNEEETMLLTGDDDRRLGDPTGFVREFQRYLPSDIKFADGSFSGAFLQNGGLVYDGGCSTSDDGVNLERTTPECTTLDEYVAHIQANEKLLVTMLGSYVANATYLSGRPEIARAQRRVMDSVGNHRGCHDNFELRGPGLISTDSPEAYARENALVRFLQTRSFMTGAGYINNSGAHFAQKVESLDSIQAYGYCSSVFRTVDKGEDTGARLEVRLNDINISPWAIKARIGGVALLLTSLQTPLEEKIVENSEFDMDQASRLNNFYRFNRANIDGGGVLRYSEDTMAALDHQEKILELMDEELGDYVELPLDYQKALLGMRNYCDDFRKVIHGELPLDVLADRSDMAAKFGKVAGSIEKSRHYGSSRKPGDYVSQAQDFRYDYIDIRPGSDGKPRTTYGYGYRMRDNGQFRDGVSALQVEQAYYLPPKGTRASIRGSLIRHEAVESCDWGEVKLAGQDLPLRLNNVLPTDGAAIADRADKLGKVL